MKSESCYPIQKRRKYFTSNYSELFLLAKLQSIEELNDDYTAEQLHRDKCVGNVHEMQTIESKKPASFQFHSGKHL